MKKSKMLADYDHPLVRETAQRLISREDTDRAKLEKLFYYVRDEIKFGFPKDGDLVKASDTIKTALGQCNTKTTLFLALCKAVGTPARIHFSTIKKDIQKGLFTGIAYRLMPPEISHSWIEIEVDGKWRRIDSYINDMSFYGAGKGKLKSKGWDTGYSIACSGGSSSADFNIDEERFVQMDAVVEDHGVWSDPMDYYKTDKYKNRPNFIKLLLYRLMVGGINNRVEHIRNSCSSSGLCGD